MKNLYISKFVSSVQLLLAGFNYVNVPYYIYKEGAATFNFDAVLIFEEDIGNFVKENKILLEESGIPAFGLERPTKLMQCVILKKLCIIHPAAYDIFGGRNLKNDMCIWDTILSHLSPDQEIVFKPMRGARGIGQMKTTVKKAYESYYEVLRGKNKDSSSLGEEKPMPSYSRIEKQTALYCSSEGDEENEEYLKSILSSNDYFIQLYESSIQKEYRVLAFQGNHFMVVERKREDGKWQCERGGKYITNDIHSVLKPHEVDQLNSLLKETNSPFLSVDIYLDKNGDMGILEFQMEFGYHNSDYDIDMLKNYMVESVNTMINEKRS